MVDANLDQQMEEVLNVTGDDPLSDAMGDRLVTQQTSMLADVAGKDGYIYEPDQKLDYRDTMGLLFPMTPEDPIFDDIKKMFEEEAYAPALATSALAALAIIPGFGRLPKAAAKKIARDTAESLKKSESKVAPDLDIPPAPPKRNRLTEQNTYDLPIDNSVSNYLNETDNYYSKLFDDILGLESSKLVDKDGNIKVKVFEKWLDKNFPGEAGQAQIKYTGLQNLIDNAKKEGVEKLSVRDTIADRYDNNPIVLSENVRSIDPEEIGIDEFGEVLELPTGFDAPKYISFSDHNNRFFVGGGGSNFTTNNITIDPNINPDYSIPTRMGTTPSRLDKQSFLENVLYPNVEPLINIKNYEEMTVSLPALPKDTTVSVSPLPRTKTRNPDAIKTFPTRKDYTHDHYPDELTKLFHIRYTKNADIGDGKPDTFIWHEGQSDIAQRRQYVVFDKDGEPLRDAEGNIITKPVVTQIDKTNPKTGIARSLETRYREAEVADELLQKRQKAIEGMDKPTVTVRGREKTEPYFPDPDYFEQDSELRDRIKEGLGDVSFSEKSILRVHDNIDSTLAAEKRPTRSIYDATKPEEIEDIDFRYRDPGDEEPKRILPEIPFLKGDEVDKSKINNLMFRRALKQAIDSGHDKFAWPTSETIGKFSGGSNAPTGVLKTYDVDFINMAKKIYNSTKKPKDPAFEEWWRMEERVRPISFEGTFKIKDDVSQTDLYLIAESIQNGLNMKRLKIHNKMEELKVEQRQNPSNIIDKDLKKLQEIYENQFKELVVSQQNVLLRIDQFKKNISRPSGSKLEEETRQNLIKEINNIYSKPSGIKLEKQFKPYVIPGSGGMIKGKRVDNLMPHIENNPLVGDLAENSNIQNYFVMEITPEMKATFSRGIPFNKGGIVQDKMDNQMKQLFAK